MSRNTTRRVFGTLGIALATTLTLAPAGGAAETETDAGWLVDGYGRPLEPYVQIPEEIRMGVPSSMASIEGAPGRCQAVGSLYDFGLFEGVGAILSENKYKNPSKAWAINPESAQPTKQENVTFPGGPRTRAECATPDSGTGESTVGPYTSKDLTVESASSRTTTAKVPGEDLIVTETTNKLHDVNVGGVSIASIVSWLQVEFRPSAEPKLSYKIEVTGVNDGKAFSGAGHQGVVLSGQNLAGAELSKQFNEQAKANQGAVKALGQYGLTLIEPRVGFSSSGRFVFEVGALDASFSPKARESGVGQALGFRLGVSRAAGRYELVGTSTPHDGYEYLEDPATGVS